MSKFPISFTLHLPLSHASFFPFPTSTRHQRDERQKGLTWLTLLGRGVVPSGLTGCLLWFAVGCACVCGGGWFLAFPPPGTCECTSLEADPWRSVVQSLPSALSPFQVVLPLRTQAIADFCGVQDQSSGKFTPLTHSGATSCCCLP